MSSDLPTVLVAHPTADLYGADLQLLESVSALIRVGYKVVVALSNDGPLCARIEARGADVRIVDFPILRRSVLAPGTLLKTSASHIAAVARIRSLLRDIRPRAVYVNTVTIPVWLISARIAHIPALCHVHEAESSDHRGILLALNAPLSLASAIICNSRASIEATCRALPTLRKRIRLIYNGVSGPTPPPAPALELHHPLRLAVIGRLSPRKGTHVALETLAILRGRGFAVELDVCGDAFPGYEYYVDDLHRRAVQLQVTDAVHWLGHVTPIWSVLEGADIVLAPSLREPFGNVIVEAQLCNRPVVAAAAMGHLETASDGAGLLVAPNDAVAAADAIQRLIKDNDLRLSTVERAHNVAARRFSLDRYADEIHDLVSDLAG